MIPAAPAQPARDAVKAWDDVFSSLEQDLRKWTRRIDLDRSPLTADEQAALRSLITTIKSLAPMSETKAQIAAGAYVRASEAASRSLAASMEALPSHVLDTIVEAQKAVKYANIANPRAVASVVNGSIGQMTTDWTKLSIDMQNRIINRIAQSVALGESPRKAAQKLAAELGDDFAFGQARSLMISRTTMAAAYDQASAFVYGQAAADGLVYGWEWLASPGACPVCSALNGQVFPPTQPPYRHPNCRCATAPVTTGSDKDGQSYFRGDTDVRLQTSEGGWTTWTPESSKERQK